MGAVAYQGSHKWTLSRRSKTYDSGPFNVNSKWQTDNGEKRELLMIGWSANVLAIAIGGALGALGRYGITLLFTQTAISRATTGLSHFVGGGASFGTTIANLTGCLLLGGLYQWSETVAAMAETPLNPKVLLAIRVGFLGSLTTFSTLIGDCAVLGSEGRPAVSLTLLSVNLIGGWVLFLFAIWAVRGIMSGVVS